MHSYQTVTSNSTNTRLIQAQLKVGEPGDKYEREADAMANRIMSVPQNENSLQRACASCGEDELQMNPMPEVVLQMQPIEEEEEVQQSKTKKPKQIQRAVDPKKVSCGSYKADHPTIKVIGTTTPVDTLKAANTKAISLLESTIGTLEFIRGKVSAGTDPSYPTFSDCTGMSLKTRFKMNPESKSTWVGKGKTETLVKWYKKIKDILSGDKMKYTCIDKFADCGVASWGAAIPGQYRIYLCKPWWSASLADQGLTLIHETSHIYYDTDDYIGATVMNAHCLEKFVAETNNIPIVKQFEKGCGGKNDSC